MVLRFEDNQGIQALDQNQIIEVFSGNSVSNGVETTVDSGTLGQSDTIQVGSGDVIVGGSKVSVSQQNAQIDSSDPDNPRKDVVFVDSTGNVQVDKGSPEDPEPEGANRFDLFQPAPPERDGVDGAVVAEVFVGAGVSSISSNDVRDRRLVSNLTVDQLQFFDSLNFGDDQNLNFGDAPDFSIKYDSNDDELKIRDEVNDVEKQTWDKNGDSFFPNGAVGIKTDTTSEDFEVNGTEKVKNQILNQAGEVFYPDDRKEITEQTKTVDPTPLDTKTVNIQGTDYEYWIPDVPQTVAHQIEYNIPDGDYSNIHVFIPNFTLGDSTETDNNDGSKEGVRLKGNPTTPTNVKFASLETSGNVGAISPEIQGLNFTGNVPTSNEDASIIFYGSKHPSIIDTSFEGSTANTGIVAYSSDISVGEGTDLGSDDLTTGIVTKHGGTVNVKNNGVKGSVTDKVFRVRGNGRILGKDVSATGGNGLIDSTVEGIFVDGDSSLLYSGNIRGGTIDSLGELIGEADSISIKADGVGDTKLDLVAQNGGTNATQLRYVSDSGNIEHIIKSGDGQGVVFTVGRVDEPSEVDIQGDIKGDGALVWDNTNGEIPDSAMGTISNSTLANSSFTASAGDGLKGGGSTSLGGSFTFNIEPADFAGNYLADDGSDNLAVQLGNGLGGDGSNNIAVQTDSIQTDELDESANFNFSSQIDFSGGIGNSGSTLQVNDDIDFNGNTINGTSEIINEADSVSLKADGTGDTKLDLVAQNSNVNAIQLRFLDNSGDIEHILKTGGGDGQGLVATLGRVGAPSVFKVEGSLNMSDNIVNNVDFFEGQDIKSSAPSSPSAGDWYIDDGSNTSSGNLAIRIYNGTSWVDQN